jgi:hypothetical protein
VTNTDIARHRLANQRLVGKPFRSPTDVVGRLGAVQAQDYSGAKWAVAQRTRGATDASIEALISRGAILRTHVLRPTWHFVLPVDIRWMLALTAPRIARQMSYNNRRLGLTPKIFARTNDALARALEGGTQLTRPQIADVLTRARVDSSDGLRVAHLLMQAELDAVICSGARRGKQFTYALLDERAPATNAIDRDEALAMLATRYFATRSPATPQDFAWWSGMTVADARRGAEAARIRDLTESPAPTSSVHLLPNYDEFFIGYRDRSAILDRVGGAAPLQRAAAPFANVIEIDGQLVGGWRRVAEGGSVAIETTYLAKVSPAERQAVQAQVERYRAFAAQPE